ncbi:MAG: HDIG domain-containing protein [Muribaculaceae bacterium]|nr:HDIG domain-containing protein [Muribaculaceae bacterium]
MTFDSKKITTHIIWLILSIVAIVYFLPRSEEETLTYEENRPWNHAMLRAPFEIYIYPDTAEVIDSLNKAFTPICQRNVITLDSLIGNLAKNPIIRQLVSDKILAQYEKGVVDNDLYSKIESGQLNTIRILDGKILKKIPTDNLVSPRKLYLMIDSLIQDSISRKIIKEANLQQHLTPNITVSEEISKQAYNNDLARATAPIGIIMQNERIIDRGEIVTHKLYRILNTYENMLKQQAPESSRSEWFKLLGNSLYVLILITLLYLYLQNFCRASIYHKGNLLFILLIISIFAIFATFASTLFVSGIYLVPFVIIPIVILVFFDARTALFCHIIEIMICASFAPLPLEFIIVEFCAGAVAVFSLKELSKRSQLLRTALLVFIAYSISYISIEFLLNGTLSESVLRILGFIAINSVLTSFAYILMFVIEKVFGFISVVSLVELSDINNPILRELSEQCPGTFQHSLAVSNLVADAVGRIGGNVQLVRAGALYHDIGKLNNPAFFTENQRGVNPHDSLDPIKSAEIVINHVHDGIKRAGKAKLPKVLHDFISQHHGCGKAKYFYITYCQNHPNEIVDEAPFTYPGPNPNTKETSVLMMADAVEAASRSMSDHSIASITTLVNRIIDTQIEEGLHNDSPISFRDIKVIKEAFINRVSTMYHSRIVYPSEATSATSQQQTLKL